MHQVASSPNETRAARGRRAIEQHPDFDQLDLETAAADTIADVLHALPAARAAAVLDEAARTFHGDHEDA